MEEPITTEPDPIASDPVAQEGQAPVSQPMQDPVQEPVQTTANQGAENATDVQMEQPATKGGGKKWLVIVVLLLVVGIGAVVYGFMQGKKAREERLSQDQELARPTQAVKEEDVLTNQYGQISTSDETISIESDLNNTTFTGLDKELADIDGELSATN